MPSLLPDAPEVEAEHGAPEARERLRRPVDGLRVHRAAVQGMRVREHDSRPLAPSRREHRRLEQGLQPAGWPGNLTKGWPRHLTLPSARPACAAAGPVGARHEISDDRREPLGPRDDADVTRALEGALLGLGKQPKIPGAVLWWHHSIELGLAGVTSVGAAIDPTHGTKSRPSSSAIRSRMSAGDVGCVATRQI